jgi:sporulation protein YlmC with PRC-barrel domain
MAEKMKRIVSVMLLLLFFETPILTTLDAAERTRSWKNTHKLSTLIKSEVRNVKGERLGQIEDFVMEPQSGRIALVVFSHAGVAGMGQKVKIIPYDFLSLDEAGNYFTLDVSQKDLTSPTEVRNLKREKLGEIIDLIIDSQGRILFVMLSHVDKAIVIPYPALSVERNYFVLDASEDKLASAPTVGEDEKSIDQLKAAEIYRYFGQVPYWTEEF